MPSPFGLYKDSTYLDERSAKAVKESANANVENLPLVTRESVQEAKSKLADAETLLELLAMFGALSEPLQRVTYAYATALKGQFTKAKN